MLAGEGVERNGSGFSDSGLSRHLVVQPGHVGLPTGLSPSGKWQQR